MAAGAGVAFTTIGSVFDPSIELVEGWKVPIDWFDDVSRLLATGADPHIA